MNLLDTGIYVGLGFMWVALFVTSLISVVFSLIMAIRNGFKDKGYNIWLLISIATLGWLLFREFTR